jgi:hypothetical protein
VVASSERCRAPASDGGSETRISIRTRILADRPQQRDQDAVRLGTAQSVERQSDVSPIEETLLPRATRLLLTDILGKTW